MPVIWRIAAGNHAPGFARLTGRGIITAVAKVNGRKMQFKGSTLPPYWRPASFEDWPISLPIPVDERDLVGAVPEFLADEDALVEEWPHHGVTLGRGEEPPKSIRETEARILRCIRTAEVLEKERPQQSANCWPPVLIQASREVAMALRRAISDTPEAPFSLEALDHGERALVRRVIKNPSDLDDIWIDRSDARPRRVGWNPSPRDVSDYEFDPNPLTWVASDWMPVFRLHAADPPYTWQAIADFFRIPPATLIEDYNAALEQAQLIAREQRRKRRPSRTNARRV